MQNELKYTVRSREIVDLISAMRSNRLNISPYFQRNLVWRDSHKRDFIDTIIKGYPFPQIFLSRGPINLDTMEAGQAVVDGQQRLSTIRDFVDGKLDINGKFFKNLPDKIREDFLKYEVAVIDFDLDAGDSRLKDIFHRLNRTYYSLSAIEKLASEYSASEFMLVARVLCGEIQPNPTDENTLDEFDIVDDETGGPADEINVFSRDPGIDDETWEWLSSEANGPYSHLIKHMNIFTPFEFDRKIPLMFTLNLMCTYLVGYYQRNDKVRKFLDEFSQEFENKEYIIRIINDAATYISDMSLPEKSMWWSKANFFTLISELILYPKLMSTSSECSSRALQDFARDIPPEYALAAREAVSRKPQRELRGQKVRDVLLVAPTTHP